MEKMGKLKRYCIIGAVFVTLAGTLSHFVYEWSGESFLLGFIFPVNESTWEHMKLYFFPMLVCSLILNRKLKTEYPCITSALLGGILFGTFLIPVIFYTYSGILGRNCFIMDLATFLASVILGFLSVYRNTVSCKRTAHTNWLKASVFILTLCFFAFSYLPPEIGLFE